MPRRLPSPCGRCRVTLTSERFCEDCKPQTGWGSKRNSDKRGYGWAWKKKRDRVMERDQGLCQPCNRKGYLTQATEVDHIKPKAKGGTDDDENLQAICSQCHVEKTVKER